MIQPPLYRMGKDDKMGGENVFPDHILSFAVEQLKQIHSVYSQDETNRKIWSKKLWIRIRMVHGKKPYYKKLYKAANYRLKIYLEQRTRDGDAHRGNNNGVSETTKEKVGNDERMKSDHHAIIQSNKSDVGMIMMRRNSPSSPRRYPITKVKGKNTPKRRPQDASPIMIRNSPPTNLKVSDPSRNPTSEIVLCHSSDKRHANGTSVGSCPSREANSITTRTITEHLQLSQYGFMEISMSDPSQTLTMCINCRMVPIQFRFPDSFCIGPCSIFPIQNHQRNCHTSGLDLTATANALDEIIRLDFNNDVQVLQRDTFVNVIRAALIHDTLVTIFTRNVTRLIYQQRGLTPEPEDTEETDPNVVPPNAWQLFPTTVDYDAVETALQRFAIDIGSTSFQMDEDYPNFVHFLLMISPGLHATRKFDV